ncbi:hypothetical protein CPT_Muldoon_013 [Serratia phage Muldoon]|uniref:Uncharacterized protein n=1 Tax=Serratia phage Muldoon TaxID=2601678 RepID=A0A5P8PIU7_9CAUD|nr:MazG-like pyrophosphatase [Serratia phage Muldoon]QFR55970.1 hypothetical protein CPT_Muldoon_013 [Serratia phage Muldoon]
MIETHKLLKTSAHADKLYGYRAIESVMLHLASETGEACDWVLRPWRQKEEFAGECADVIICVVDALRLHIRRSNPEELSDKEIDEMLRNELNKQISIKTDKWKNIIDADVQL